MKIVRKLFEESGYTGYVFNRADLDSNLDSLDYEDLIEYLGTKIQQAGSQIIEYYGGPGQAFADRPAIWLGKSRVLVTQYFGYDV
jgi:hypothetical protein